MSSGKIVVKVLKYTRTASAKLKIFRKISSQKTEKNSILFRSMQYTNFRRSLRNSITQVVRERKFITQWQQNKKIMLLITRNAQSRMIALVHRKHS